jgi:hypothetical protein
MTRASSALDPAALAQAKALLARPQCRERIWPVLGAAAVLALSALTFATAMILAPPLNFEHATIDHGAR